MADALVEAALAARANAFAPFSKFQVGAAVEDCDGRIHTGCNVENATYGLTICAERVAVFKAISTGARQFRRVGVSDDTDALTPPRAAAGGRAGRLDLDRPLCADLVIPAAGHRRWRRGRARRPDRRRRQPRG